MIAITPLERRMRRELIRVASTFTVEPQHPGGITYGDLGVLVDPIAEHRSGDQPHTRPPFRGFFEALGHVSIFEVEHGRPMLSALVVNAETGTPGEGFERLAKHLGFDVDDPDAFWRREALAVYDYWRDAVHDPTVHIDAAVEVIYAEIRNLREVLRRSP